MLTLVKKEKIIRQLKKYMKKRKKRNPMFAKEYDVGYSDFKVGVLLRQAREEAGLTQRQLAKKLHTKKSAISRIENHAEDIRLSTLEKFAAVLGKRVKVVVG